MGYTVKNFSAEDKRAFVAEHPAGKPKDWAVMDGGIVYGFFDCEEEARAELLRAENEEAIAASFDDWAEYMCERYSVDLKTVQDIVSAEL